MTYFWARQGSLRASFERDRVGVRLVTEMGGNAGDSGDMPVFIHRNLPPPTKREWEQRGQNRPMSGPLLALLVPSVPSIEEWSGDGRTQIGRASCRERV